MASHASVVDISPFEPKISSVIIPYHVTPSEQLQRLTYEKLESVGFPRSPFGSHAAASWTAERGPSRATTLLQFSEFTQDHLHPEAGGVNPAAPRSPSKNTSASLKAASPPRKISLSGLQADFESAVHISRRGDDGTMAQRRLTRMTRLGGTRSGLSIPGPRPPRL